VLVDRPRRQTVRDRLLVDRAATWCVIGCSSTARRHTAHEPMIVDRARRATVRDPLLVDPAAPDGARADDRRQSAARNRA
jgi:hypothetical protein